MIICPNCGSHIADASVNCPVCGAPIAQQNPYGNPYAQNPYGSPYPQQPPVPAVTSPLGWFGWMMLCSFLPIIGAIIMLSATEDQSAKNFAKCWIVLQIIGLVLGVLLAMLMIAGLGSVWLRY